ncbi:MAG: hypothetical protein JSW71_06125 [Gemmatimonadota bacterium]|nr:MAG: hypothetical protein JSW71_06125 [Gemmatimonadota bacterium]
MAYAHNRFTVFEIGADYLAGKQQCEFAVGHVQLSSMRSDPRCTMAMEENAFASTAFCCGSAATLSGLSPVFTLGKTDFGGGPMAFI